jgi:hypothetical protein
LTIADRAGTTAEAFSPSSQPMSSASAPVRLVIFTSTAGASSSRTVDAGTASTKSADRPR